ncbi:hypothetical protein [Azospirillum cavernae]|uniref:hypothetical protein n=1 Tax=Azospirillum cavernae TaxID=2320860 RepID=UPI0011C4661D|nr:hypothetical protein [Azospirillum cavernae]
MHRARGSAFAAINQHRPLLLNGAPDNLTGDQKRAFALPHVNGVNVELPGHARLLRFHGLLGLLPPPSSDGRRDANCSSGSVVFSINLVNKKCCYFAIIRENITINHQVSCRNGFSGDINCECLAISQLNTKKYNY